MVADRGQRRIARTESRRRAPKPTSYGVQLAVGVRLVRASAQQKPPMLIFKGAKIQLNEGAHAILALCDGSRSREQIIAEASQRAPDGALAADISAFLDAAQTRGWIIDKGNQQ